MTLDFAIQLTEVLLGLAFLQQSAEHIFGPSHTPVLFIPRAALSSLLIFGFQSEWTLLALCIHSLFVLHRYNGPYNGGSDRMGLLILYCLCLALWLPRGILTEAIIGYLGVQVILSYFISGKVKIINPEWRSGRALRDIFSFSAYPVSESLRRLEHHPKLLWFASWAVMLFEVFFPLSFLHSTALIFALIIAIVFHITNACLFGLNRFIWFWVASYPSIIWLQARFMQSG